MGGGGWGGGGGWRGRYGVVNCIWSKPRKFSLFEVMDSMDSRL